MRALITNAIGSFEFLTVEMRAKCGGTKRLEMLILLKDNRAHSDTAQSRCIGAHYLCGSLSTSQEAFAAFIAKELPKYAKIVKESGAKVD